MKLSARSFPSPDPDNEAAFLKKAKNAKPLPANFYLRPTPTVARDLIGKGLYFQKGKSCFFSLLVEVEAYLGLKDPASHAFRGITKRNWPMFEKGGTCYVYLSYGMNDCMNVATGRPGVGQAILFRAAIPLVGLKTMATNRKNKKESYRPLLSGPGKLTQAYGISRDLNGETFDRPTFKLIDFGLKPSRSQVIASPRIGISKAKDLPLRFTLKDSAYLSRKVER